MVTRRSSTPTASKIDLYIQRNVDRFPAASSRSELPLFECLNSILIQTQSQTAQHFQDLNRAVLADDSRQDNTALIPRSPGVPNSLVGLDTIHNRGSADSATNPVESTARSLAFARTYTRSFARPNTPGAFANRARSSLGLLRTDLRGTMAPALSVTVPISVLASPTQSR